MSHPVTEQRGILHEGDCLGSLCPTCGCCLHCDDRGDSCPGRDEEAA